MTSKAMAADKRFYGVTEAIVTDVDDPEKEGRVKVSFPWFDSDMESEWCRVAQLYAGRGDKGSMFVPDKEDEVLVAFVHGDMRMGVILGGLYNGSDKPPTYRDSATDQKMIRTRSGHEILFDDTAGAERVRITTQGGHTFDLDDVGQKVVIETTGGQSVTLDASGAVTVKGTTSVTLDAPQVKLGSSANFKAVMGDVMQTLFDAHVHTCSVSGSPSSPPIGSMSGALSSVVKTS